MNTLSRRLRRLDACEEAVAWANTQPSIKTAWENCERGDWMLWILGQGIKQGDARHRKIVLAACGCARLLLKDIPKEDERSLNAIELAEQWARSESSVLDAVAWAAYAAWVADGKQCADIFREVFTVKDVYAILRGV